MSKAAQQMYIHKDCYLELSAIRQCAQKTCVYCMAAMGQNYMHMHVCVCVCVCTRTVTSLTAHLAAGDLSPVMRTDSRPGACSGSRSGWVPATVSLPLSARLEHFDFSLCRNYHRENAALRELLHKSKTQLAGQ